MVMIEGISVSIDFVKNLKDKRFVIAANPEYIEMPDFKDKTKKIKKLCIKVIIYQDRSQMDYIPNNGTIKALVNLYGSNTENWVGKFFEWLVIEKPVPYITISNKIIKPEDIKEITF